MTRILLTGASGLLGATLLFRGRDRFEMLACTLDSRLRPDGFEARQVDLSSAAELDRLVRSFAPDWICHCAALTDVDLCQRCPTLAHEINVTMSENLSRAAASRGARMLMVSTDSVFDGRQPSYAEDDEARPLNEYARSKLISERRTAAWLPNVLIVRTNFYGWSVGRKQSLAEWVLGGLRRGTTIPAWTDVFFNPLFTADLADCLLATMEHELSGVYHAASATPCSKHGFAHAIAETWGLDPSNIRPALSTEANLEAPRPQNTTLRYEKLVDRMNWSPPGLQEGLRRMRSWEEAELPRLRDLMA